MTAMGDTPEQHNEHCLITWRGERWWIDEIYEDDHQCLVFLANEERFAYVPLKREIEDVARP